MPVLSTQKYNTGVLRAEYYFHMNADCKMFCQLEESKRCFLIVISESSPIRQGSRGSNFWAGEYVDTIFSSNFCKPNLTWIGKYEYSVRGTEFDDA